ncbi:Sodium channel protein type 11 subunit alpha [Symbiodinium microadriaticum]|uniref:Sodium channel protein type 11 subunit alpha n=1 Tax=Symbiodinium microadriaticum TaxID=2951 RepID=A0A1Q9CJZ0_SYMMI|nr:Sodium channel protein type 11 subunit alpha [Symbiodinium microadriaticum]
MRQRRTFKEVTAGIMTDVSAFLEAMATPPVRPEPKGKEKLTEVNEDLRRSGEGTLNRLHCLEQQAHRLEAKAQTVEGKLSHVSDYVNASPFPAASSLKKDLLSLQEQDSTSFAELHRGLQSHAGVIRELAVNDQVASIHEDLGGWKRQHEAELKVVVGEISRIHQVLHLDFVKVQQDELVRRALLGPKGNKSPQAKRSASIAELVLPASFPVQVEQPRFRDFFSQTEPAPVKESHSQTDPALFMDMTHEALKPRKREQRQPHKKVAFPQRVIPRGEDHLKLQAKVAAMEPPYNVFDYYHETGCCQAIARHPWFENFTLLVVFLNACWMAVDVDYNTAVVLIESHPAIIAIENAFCGYFFLELVIRFCAFEEKCYAFQDMWFCLDLLLVILYAVDTWLVTILVLTVGFRMDAGTSTMVMLRMLRLVKLCRLTRLAKLLRAVPELVIIMKGIGYASRSVSVFFMFWIIISYAFAIGIRQLTDNTEVGLMFFPSVPEAMNTLLLQGLFPESTELISAISGGSSWFLWPITVFFLSLVSLTVMYMLVGVLVDVVHVVASVEKDSLAVSYLAHEMRISKVEFQKLVVEPSIARIASRLRGSNPARVKDFVEQLKLIKHIVRDSSEGLNKKLKRAFETMKLEMQDVKEEIRELREAEVRDRAMRNAGLQISPDSSESISCLGPMVEPQGKASPPAEFAHVQSQAAIAGHMLASLALPAEVRSLPRGWTLGQLIADVYGAYPRTRCSLAD